MWHLKCLFANLTNVNIPEKCLTFEKKYHNLFQIIPSYKLCSWPRDINNRSEKSKFIDYGWPDMTFGPEWPDVPGQNLLRNTEIQWSGFEPLLTFLMSSIIFPDIHSFDRGHVRISVRIIKTDNLKTGGRITNSFIFNLVDDWSKLKIFRSDQSNDFKSLTKNDSSSENESSRVNFNSERILKQRIWKLIQK